MAGIFSGSARMTRFLLRRERFISSVWIVGLAGFCVSLASGMGAMFPDEARQALAETLKNPGVIAMMGPVYGAGNYTVGAMYSNTTLLWTALAVAVMNILLVVRHTRADEERGRVEVLRSLPAGRLVNLNATMIVAVIVNAALAALIWLGISAVGVESMGVMGSLLYGLTLGVVGLLFAAVAAVFSQLCASSRGAMGCSFLALGILYMLRAAGDIGNELLSLGSPLGLMQRAQVFVENRWGPVLILLLETAAIAAVAYGLNAVRDMDQGFISARPGRKAASPMLLSPFGLAFRLLRNSLLTWLIVMFALGASYGSILGDIGVFVAESEFYQRIIGVNEDYPIALMFTTMVNAIAALICLTPLLAATMKPRSEEKEQHAEHVLARAVTRTQYMAGYVALAFAASVLFQLASALGLYAAGAAVLEEPIALGLLLQANMVYLPALWVMMGLAVLLVGLLPEATGLAWAYYGFSFFAVLLGRMVDLPEWVTRLTPFNHIPQLPVDDIRYGTLAALTVIAAALTAGGFFFYHRRDTMAA